MTILLDARVPRTLATLLTTYGSGDRHGAVVEAWLFEDQPARREAEIRLARAGVRARLRSAYKPLVHAFLEEIPTRRTHEPQGVEIPPGGTPRKADRYGH